MPRPKGPSENPSHDAAFVTLRAALAANMKRRRAEAEISQQKLAELAGMSVTYVQSLERVTRAENPTLRALAALAAGLECTASDLVSVAPTRQKRVARSR